MADPAEDVPADRPPGGGNGGFDLGALGLGVSGTVGVGAVVELADQFHGAFERVQAAIAVIADGHSPTADRAVAVEDVEFEASEIGVRGPSVGHGADLPDWDSVWRWKEHCEDRQDLQWVLACCSVIAYYSGAFDSLVFSGLKPVIAGPELPRLAAAIPDYQSATDDALKPYV